MTLPRNSPKRVIDHITLNKDLIPQASMNDIDAGPEILNDPIFRQQCENWGYAIYQIGDRLVRIYCKPPDKRVLGDATPGQQPEAYVGIQPGTDPRFEMSAQDNLERGRNTTKALMRMMVKATHEHYAGEFDSQGRWRSEPGKRPESNLTDAQKDEVHRNFGRMMPGLQEMFDNRTPEDAASDDARGFSPESYSNLLTNSQERSGWVLTPVPRGPDKGQMYLFKPGDPRSKSEEVWAGSSDFYGNTPGADIGTWTAQKHKLVNGKWVPTPGEAGGPHDTTGEEWGEFKPRPGSGGENVFSIPISKIDVKGQRFRDAAVVEDYRANIRDKGISSLEPIRLESNGDRYSLMDGFHRVTAAQKEGETSIPAHVRRVNWDIPNKDPKYQVQVEKGLNPNQERVPAGQTGGGQFAGSGAVAGESEHRKKFPPGMPKAPEAKPYPKTSPDAETYGKKPYTTYKGVDIYCKKDLSETDKQLYSQGVKSGMDKMPIKADHCVSYVQVTDEKGPSFMAGGNNHSEAGNFNPTNGVVTIRTTSSPEFWANDGIPHEFGHAVWTDTGRRFDTHALAWNTYEHNVAEDMKSKGYPWFGKPSEMKTGDGTGSPDVRFDSEKWAKSDHSYYGDRSINNYLTEDLTQERNMASGRHGFADISNFSNASEKEGGVSAYARDHLKERHYTENFAEMTEQNVWRGRNNRLEYNRTTYPKSFRSWRAMMLRYGWQEPKS